MGGTLGGGVTLHVDFKCFVCKERKQDVRPVPGSAELYACLNCVPVGQEQTAVLQHQIKQLRREASGHYARYIAAYEETERLERELASLLDSGGCQSIVWVLSDESGVGGESVCGKPVVAVLDAGAKHELRLCAECAAGAHPRRLTWLSTEETDPAESLRTALQEVMDGDVLPVSQLWDGIEEERSDV